MSASHNEEYVTELHIEIENLKCQVESLTKQVCEYQVKDMQSQCYIEELKCAVSQLQNQLANKNQNNKYY